MKFKRERKRGALITRFLQLRELCRSIQDALDGALLYDNRVEDVAKEVRDLTEDLRNEVNEVKVCLQFKKHRKVCR